MPDGFWSPAATGPSFTTARVSESPCPQVRVVSKRIANKCQSDLNRYKFQGLSRPNQNRSSSAFLSLSHWQLQHSAWPHDMEVHFGNLLPLHLVLTTLDSSCTCVTPLCLYLRCGGLHPVMKNSISPTCVCFLVFQVPLVCVISRPECNDCSTSLKGWISTWHLNA